MVVWDPDEKNWAFTSGYCEINLKQNLIIMSGVDKSNRKHENLFVHEHIIIVQYNLETSGHQRKFRVKFGFSMSPMLNSHVFRK